VFLAALPQAGQAHGLPRAEPQPLLDTLRRARFPVKSVFVALPLGHAHGGRIRGRLGAGFEVASFEGWLLVRAHGPFADRDAALRAIRATLAAARPRVGPPQLIAWFDLERSVVGRALAAG
jgi:hypothetical protein